MSGQKTPPEDDERLALSNAMGALLRPMAELAIAKGMPYAALEELLKRSFFDAAREVQLDPTAKRMVSRISAATGLSRREVTRLCSEDPTTIPPGRTLANEVFAHWTTSPGYRDRKGQPLPIPRTGAAPSFEALAHSVTRDVHPRSLLEELLRLGLATHDEMSDIVCLSHQAYVPRGDAVRMLDLLGNNVGDHLKAAAQNVLEDGRSHFEQAVFADELSPTSIKAARDLVRTQWQSLIDTMVPHLERMIAEDEAQNRVRHQRLRIGLYSFHETMAPPARKDKSLPASPRKRKESK